MKKLLLLLAVCFLFQTSADARDYAKLQAKEIKQVQKYGTTNRYMKNYAPQTAAVMNNNIIKDPKLIKIGEYQEISSAKYKEKLAKDNLEYAKIEKQLKSSGTDNYHGQAYAEDFNRVYRIAERIIRANNLNFIDWRITIQRNTEFNAYNSNTNNITILTGLYDTFATNDNALAFLIGHEMGHALLGHSARKARIVKKVNRAVRLNSVLGYVVSTKKYLIESKNMEYSADVEGAKLVAKAGFDLGGVNEAIAFMNTLSDGSMERHSTHPNSEHRLENYEQNKKYFPMEEWKKQGNYNIYKSNVLNCKKSSDRKSIVIMRGTYNDTSSYYHNETLDELYKRYGYMSYKNGNFKDAIKYFKKVLDENRSDYAVYLYISYSYYYLGDKESAKEFAEYAQRLAPDNKYVKEQLRSL